MMGPDVVVPVAGMMMIVSIVLGVPLVRARIRERERRAAGQLPEAQLTQRLERIEAAVESIAIEVERISEGQRFVTKLLAEKGTPPLPPPQA